MQVETGEGDEEYQTIGDGVRGLKLDLFMQMGDGLSCKWKVNMHEVKFMQVHDVHALNGFWIKRVWLKRQK